MPTAGDGTAGIPAPRLFRLLLGASLGVYYGSFIGQADLYFGSDSMVEAFGINPWHFHFVADASPNTASLLLIVLLVLLGMFSCGLIPAYLTPVIYLLHLGFYHANPFIIHEPVQLLSLLLLTSPLLDLNRKSFHAKDLFFIRALALFFGTYYFTAGLKKLGDPAWLNGSALEDLLHMGWITRENLVVDWLRSSPQVTRMLTYSALFWELAVLPLYVAAKGSGYS